MTKWFCDICEKEILDEYAQVDIQKKKRRYHHKMYCLDCFYKKINWSKMHIEPEQYPPVDLKNLEKRYRNL